MKKIFTLLLIIVGLQFSSFAQQPQAGAVKDASSVTVANTNSTVYPNPATSYFNVTSDLGIGSYVEIFDVLGTMVTRIDLSDGDVYVDCSDWKRGYYFCKFISDSKIQKTMRIIVQR